MNPTSRLAVVSIVASALTAFAVSSADGIIEAIPFESWRNRVYLPTRVNGSEAFPFILDTGASSTTLSQQLAGELSLKLKKQRQERGVGAGEGSTSVGSLETIRLELSGHEVAAGGAIAIEMGNGAANGRRPYGVLGSEVFSRYVVEIDYAAKTVKLHDPLSYSYAGPGEVIPFKLEGGTPFVKVRIEVEGRKPAAGLVLIDTGSTGAVLLNTPFVNKRKFLSAGQTFLDRSVRGASGQARVLVGRAQSLQLGSFRINRPITVFSQAKSGATADSSYDGNIGGDVLRRFKVILDYSRRRMILEPNAALDDSFEYDMSGIVLTAEGRDYRTFKIDRIFKGTPAAEAGLREGDEIVAVDGAQTTGFTLDQLQSMFRQEGREYLLSVKRAEAMVQTKIKLRRLA
jgi:predicted aspartyl protease